MPLFRRKDKSKPSISSSIFRSVEHLPPPPSAPHFDSDDSSNNISHHQHHHQHSNHRFPVSTPQHFPPQPQPQAHPHSHSHSHSHSQSQSQAHEQSQPLDSWDARQPPPRNPGRSSLQRSHTQRLRTPPDASTLSTSNSTNTITVVNNSPSSSHLAPPQSFDADVSDQSSPSSPTSTDKPDEEPRRSKRSLFSFHSSASSTSVRDQPSLLERNRSVKLTGKRQAHHQNQKQNQAQAQNQSQNQPRQYRDQEHSPRQQQQSRSSLDWTRDYAVNDKEADRRRPSMHQQSTARPQTPSADLVLPPPSRSPNPSPIPRSNTDPRLLEEAYRQSFVEHSRQGSDLAPGGHPLDLRPSSRQSVGPPSPYQFPQSETSSVSQLGAMSDRPSGGTQQSQSQAQGSNQDAGLRNNVAQQALDTGRATPTSKDNRSRDDLSELDVRTLISKHEELQAKYSKVKRYYFERDAQVQQLQNTVAHQRMAVSRTVLDDNEYANRFGRLDGAIKDLAFSIRKDWKNLPNWLTGFVNEDAPATGTKEMTAIGRSVMSRWLVDEVFERYFHPSLEPAFSQQLKSIEMTLRRQQTNTTTEEDKENAIARISNWRRTTLDGMGNSLLGQAADEYRTNLINRLVDTLVATLSGYLHDPPPVGIDTGARMIVENAIGIAEKIPLESRDICVEYVLPGSTIQDITMKIEPGILPPLTNAASPIDPRRSADEHNDQTQDDGPGTDPHDRDSPPSAHPNAPGAGAGLDGGPAAREQRMRSVFRDMIGRKPGQVAPGPGPTPPGNNAQEIRRSSVGTPGAPSGPGGSGNGNGTGRIRLAAFVTAEVRGRGPMNVLVKAPAYPIE